MAPEKVTVALSGGVDSSVAAYLLNQQGFEVRAVTMRLRSSGSDKLIECAREVCAHLGIEHQVVDFEKEFEKHVVEPFCAGYRMGLTPNPCVMCNHKIKFGLLLAAARRSGSAFLATGHYARIDRSGGLFHLLKGVDSKKDQSYFLYNLDQWRLSTLLFPLGALNKSDVETIAAEQGLPTAKSSSQDICFLNGHDYRDFLKSRIPEEAGPIIDTAANLIGTHTGIFNYTVGQRKKLGLGGGGEKQYVIKLGTNTVTVGGWKDLEITRFKVIVTSWISGRFPDRDNITVRIRYLAPESGATLSDRGSQAHIYLDRPQYGVSPGQSAVFYAGDEILGGGIISL